MSRSRIFRGLAVMFALAASLNAHADLKGADKAYAEKDFTRAYALYRELAEIGNVKAQENLAAMYVDGEGVKRDNVLGLGWAVIARENGGSAAMQNIIDQLTPHLNDAAKARMNELISIFGQAALKERLLPGPPIPANGEACTFNVPANPDDSYPPEAVRLGISGSVFVEATVGADGRAHHPVVLYSVPEGALDAGARANAFANTFHPRLVDGKAVPCSIRYKVKYRVRDSRADAAMDKALAESRKIAEAGDPIAQSIYALLMLDRTKPDPEAELPNVWFLKSAQAGVPFAQYVIGVGLLGNGRSIPESEKSKGMTWLKLAAASGQPDAKFALANYSLANEADAMSNPVVFAWLEDAARDGHRDATLRLAALLGSGTDATRREPARALTLLDNPKFDFRQDPTAEEARAAACAQLGKFDDAVAAQKRALVLAKRYGWDVGPQQARLAKYQAGTAWTGNLFDP